MVLSSMVITEGASHFERTHSTHSHLTIEEWKKLLHLYILLLACNIGKIELLFWHLTLPSHTRTPCVREKQSSTLDNVFYMKLIPKLLGAKVEIKFVYYDHNDDDNCFLWPSSHRKIFNQTLNSIPWLYAFTLRNGRQACSRYPPLWSRFDDWAPSSHQRRPLRCLMEPTPAPRHNLYQELKQDPIPDPRSILPRKRRFLPCLASVWSKVVVPSPPTWLRPCKPSTVHKFTKAFGSNTLNILPFSYKRHDQFTIKEGKLLE